ncbi:PAS domain-containing protein [uncultured Kiloniella sp.]|uniref:PAS domain-containing protein n=1 Tax=uncultured Kiloniella sp. TaxID=1133091 RepID=UPI002630947A|nr:PAS domain-containing protein [uncultured Kiloniella sp.]
MLKINIKNQPIKKLYDYWLSKAPPSMLPARHDIDPAEMAEFLPHLILLDVQANPLDFRYRLIGTHISAYLKEDLTSRWMSTLDHQKPPSRIWDNCKKAVETRGPVFPYTPYIGPKQDIVEMEDLILPLARDGINVDMLLVGVTYTHKTTD